MDVIKILKDVVTLAQKSNDIDMVQKVISAQQSILEMQEKIQKLNDENSKLKSKLEKNKSVEHYRSVPIVTVKEDNPKVYYCGVCYGKEGIFIPLQKTDDRPQCFCSNCNMVTYLNYSPDCSKLMEALK